MQSDRRSAAKQECDTSAKQSNIMTILTLLNVGYDDVVRMSTICSEAANDCPHHNGALFGISRALFVMSKQSLLRHKSRLLETQLSALACLSRLDNRDFCVVNYSVRGIVQYQTRIRYQVFRCANTRLLGILPVPSFVEPC